MRLLILAICVLLLGGCIAGRTVTTTAHQIVNDRNLDEPLGYFEITQGRWVSDSSAWNQDWRDYDRKTGSDIVVQFHNTCPKPVSFNFLVTGQGWNLRDAVVNLSPNQVYTSQRINAPYGSLDCWRVQVTDATYNNPTKRSIPSN